MVIKKNYERKPIELQEKIKEREQTMESLADKEYTGMKYNKNRKRPTFFEATGKSYMATQIAANAQKMGIDVVYFDSESAIDPTFLEKAGCDLSSLLYVNKVKWNGIL